MASVIVADVHGDAFASRPIDVTPPYDPFDPEAAVRLYATGFRNAYDLVWHSNGSSTSLSTRTASTIPTSPRRTGTFFMWGPACSAAVVATISSDPTKALIFGYQPGDEMVDITAPHRRVGFFPSEETPTHFTSDAWALFDAAITWAMGD